MNHGTTVSAQLERIEDRITEPQRLRFPEGWTTSTSWKRAQSDDAVIGPVTPIEWDVILGDGDRYRVTFAIYQGDLRAECECDGHRFRGWCAHVAYLWWRWTRGRLFVVDLDGDRTYPRPPWWLSVPDDDHDRDVSAPASRPARADGGTE